MLFTIGCGEAQDGYVTKSNSCFPNYKALGTVAREEPTPTAIATSTDGNTVTGAESFQVTADIDIWGFQVYLNADSENATMEIDLAVALASGESAANSQVTLPTGDAGDLINTSEQIPGLIKTSNEWVDFKLKDYVTLKTDQTYWMMYVPTSGEYNVITGTVEEGDFSSKDLSSSSWTVGTTTSAAYALIPCRSLSEE